MISNCLLQKVQYTRLEKKKRGLRSILKTETNFKSVLE